MYNAMENLPLWIEKTYYSLLILRKSIFTQIDDHKSSTISKLDQLDHLDSLI